MSSNLFIAWNNKTDTGALSGGSWLSSLPLSNLQNRQVQKVARSTNAALASTKFTITFPAPVAVGVLALVVHNLSSAAKVKITGSADNFATTAYNSGWLDAWDAGVIPQDALEWEDDNFWLGTMSEAERAGYQCPYIHRVSPALTLRYWQVEIDDTTNAAGSVYIGRLFMALGWAPEYNMSYGCEIGYNDPSIATETLSGAEYFDVREKYRLHNFTLGFLIRDEAYGSVLQLQRVAGVTGEVLIIPDTTDPTYSIHRRFVGRLLSVSPIIHERYGQYATKLSIKELL